MEEVNTGNWFSRTLGRFFFWVFETYLRFSWWFRPYNMWMELQWLRLWAKYPILGNDLLHNSVSMLAFVVLVVGSASNIWIMTVIGLVVMAISLVLGTVNILYNPGGKNG